MSIQPSSDLSHGEPSLCWVLVTWWGMGRMGKSHILLRNPRTKWALLWFLLFFWWLFFYLGSLYLPGSNWYFKQNFLEKLFILSMLKFISLNMFIVFFWYFLYPYCMHTYIFFFTPLHFSVISFFKKVYLFIWLHWVLAGACGI